MEMLADSIQTTAFPFKDLGKDTTSLHTVPFPQNEAKQPLSTYRRAHWCPLMNS